MLLFLSLESADTPRAEETAEVQAAAGKCSSHCFSLGDSNIIIIRPQQAKESTAQHNRNPYFWEGIQEETTG